MKQLNLLIWGLFFFIFAHSLKATENYTIDPKHTNVLWHINHFGFSNPSGKWLAKGSLQYDKDQPEKSKVIVNIDIADIESGLADLDKHIKGKLFFNMEKFPQATFVSDKIYLKDNQIEKVEGVLTLKGVSKPITLDVKLNKEGINPVTNQKTIGFSASTQLKRSDFGINALLPGLSDDVKLDIELEAYQPKQDK